MAALCCAVLMFVLAVLSAVVLVPQRASAAAEEERESLPEVLAWVYQTNPELLGAREALAAQQESLTQVLARWLPTVDLRVTGSASRSHSRDTFTIVDNNFVPVTVGGKNPDIDSHSESYQISIGQNLFRSGADKALLEQQKALIRQQQAILSGTEQNVLQRAVTAYMDVLQGEEFLRLRAADIQSLDERWRQTKAQYEVGDRTRADLAQARSRFASATAQQLQDKDNLDTARATYTQLVNRSGRHLQPVTTAPELPATLEESLRLAREANPTLARQHWAVVAARQSTRGALRGLGPSLDLLGQLTKQGQNSESGRSGRNTPTSVDSRDRVLQLSLNVPLYQGGALGGQIRQARRSENEALYNLQAQRRAIVQEVTAAWKTLEAARARRKALRIAVETAEVALSGIRSEARVGQRTVADILDAQRDLINVQVNHAGASRNIIVAVYNLLSSIGLLNAEYLGLDVELHNPQQDMRRTHWKSVLPPALELFHRSTPIAE